SELFFRWCNSAGNGRKRIDRGSGKIRMTLDASLLQQIYPDGIRIAFELEDLALRAATDVPTTRFYTEDLPIASLSMEYDVCAACQSGIEAYHFVNKRLVRASQLLSIVPTLPCHMSSLYSAIFL